MIQKLTCFSNIYVLINYLTDWYVNLVLPILLQTTVTFRKYLVTPQKRLHYSTRIITLFETHWFILVVFYLHSFALSFIGTAISPFHLLISFFLPCFLHSSLLSLLPLHYHRSAIRPSEKRPAVIPPSGESPGQVHISFPKPASGPPRFALSWSQGGSTNTFPAQSGFIVLCKALLYRVELDTLNDYILKSCL